MDKTQLTTNPTHPMTVEPTLKLEPSDFAMIYAQVDFAVDLGMRIHSAEKADPDGWRVRQKDQMAQAATDLCQLAFLAGVKFGRLNAEVAP